MAEREKAESESKDEPERLNEGDRDEAKAKGDEGDGGKPSASGADEEASDAEKGDEAGAEHEDDGDDPEQDAAARRVAEALGVDEEDGEDGAAKAAAEAKEAEAPTNRASRRREEALKRRKKKAASEPGEGEEPAEDLPKDRNKRAKELLARRREQASGGGTRPINLLPGEMVDDALARSASATSRWVRTHFSKIQWVIVAAVIGGAGFLFWRSRVEKGAASASGLLAEAVAADRGHVMAEDKRPDDVKEADPTRVFKTAELRNEAALTGFRKVASQHAGTGPAILAKLGEAGVLLDKRDYAGALTAYSAVASSTLASADPDVKGRAVEGLALAKEGKGDLDGALASFKELEPLGAKGWKELSQYHQGRILLAKGDKEAAKDLFKKVYDTLNQAGTGSPTEAHQFPYLEAIVTENLRQLDPSTVQAKMPGGKGKVPSKEDIERQMQKLREAMENKEGK